MVIGKIGAIVMWIGVIFLVVISIQEMHKLTVKPGYYTDCYDKMGNIIQNTTCWDEGTTPEKLVAEKQNFLLGLFFLGGMIAMLGWVMWSSDEWM